MAGAGGAIAALLGFAAGGSFLFVARLLLARRIEGPSGSAARSFALWWALVGWYAILVGGASNAMGFLGVADPRAYVAARSTAFVLLVAALWHLSRYYVFLFTGSTRLDVPFALVYAAVYVATAFVFAGSLAAGVRIGAFGTEIAYEPPPDRLALGLITLALSLPQLLAAVAGLALLRRLKEPTQRFRLALVAASLVLWFAFSLLAAFSDVDSPLILARPLLGLAAAGAVVLAYDPPAWVQRRFGVTRLPTS